MINRPPEHAPEVKRKILNQLNENRDYYASNFSAQYSIDSYLSDMNRDGVVPNQFTYQLAADAYKVKILIYNEGYDLTKDIHI